MNRRQKLYQDKVVPALMAKHKYSTVFAVPKISKVIVNMGVTNPQDPRARKPVIENIVTQFETITGQKPKVSAAKKSVANFKLREGDPVGVTVTLRGRKMWDFIDKLISIALPRVKDFRGVSKKAFDGQGNYSFGIEEQIIFPEINYDTIENVRGLQVNIVTSAKTDGEAFDLLVLLEVPFEKEAK